MKKFISFILVTILITSLSPVVSIASTDTQISNGNTIVYRNGKYGLTDPEGRELIPAKYDRISILGEKYLYARLWDGQSPSNDLYAITGERALPFSFREIEELEGGYFRIVKNYGLQPRYSGRVDIGLYDENMTEIISCGEYAMIFIKDGQLYTVRESYEEIELPSYGVIWKNSFFGLYDANGNEVLPQKYEAIYQFDDSQFYAIENIGNSGAGERKFGIISYDGSIILSHEYDDIALSAYDGYLRLDKASGSGLYDINLRRVIVPCEYYDDFLFNVSGGGLAWGTDRLIRVSQLQQGIPRYHYGVYSIDGTEVLPCIYTEIKLMADDSLIFKTQQGTVGYADSEGRIIVEPGKYAGIQPLITQPFYLPSGVIVFMPSEIVLRGIIVSIADESRLYNTAYGLCSPDGEEITPLIFDSITSIRGNNYPYATAKIGELEYVLCFEDGQQIAAPDGVIAALYIVESLVVTGASTWSEYSLNRAKYLNIIPEPLQSQYTQATTRAEFCALAVALYEKVTGSEITARATFVDSSDINVQKMGGLGVVQGVGEGKFAPDNTITRQEAAIMLANLMKAMGKPLTELAPTFDDNEAIASWAFTQVGQVQSAGIMSGVGDNIFSPRTSYTREQSIMTMIRLYDLMGV